MYSRPIGKMHILNAKQLLKPPLSYITALKLIFPYPSSVRVTTQRRGSLVHLAQWISPKIRLLPKICLLTYVKQVSGG